MLLCSDPIRAYLLDGECIKEWCRNALGREQSHLLQVRPCQCAAQLIPACYIPMEASPWPYRASKIRPSELRPSSSSLQVQLWTPAICTVEAFLMICRGCLEASAALQGRGACTRPWGAWPPWR